ncbi:MAG: hypothetical protein FJY10_11220 [Bacteroidetes bacterium]|nr:hypothetical protein [Bacteroidota bacterium]
MKEISTFALNLLMAFICLGIICTAGCNKKNEPTPEQPFLRNDPIGTVYDYDFNRYNLIIIGNQGWLRENVKAIHYSNGDSIPYISGNVEWANTKQGAWCNYNNESQNVKEYGHLYNWQVASDPRNICPEGFHVPMNDEFNALINFLGGYQVADGKMKEAGTTHWQPPNTGATNSSGFTALPGGSRSRYGVFNGDIGTDAYFWSSSSAPTSGDGYGVGIDNQGGDIANNYEIESERGLSIRCIQNSGSNQGLFVDPRNGHVYKTIKIGTQTWMAANLNININGSWAYNDDMSYAETYGRLYDFSSAAKACPEGWHLPDTAEWNKLINHLGGYWVSGGTMKEAGTSHWNSPNYGAYNGSGFEALAAGCRIPDSYPTDYYYLKVFANFWTSSVSKYEPTEGVYLQLDYQSIEVWPLTDDFNQGYSVRCVKNN